MKDRVVISIEQRKRGEDDIEIFFRIDEPDNVTDWSVSMQLHCDPTQDPFVKLADIAANDRNPIANDLVKEVGEKVFAGLTQHPGVREAFDRAVNMQQSGVPTAWPLYFNTRAIDAEGLPWELLYHPQEQFLCLNVRWPMARMVGGSYADIERALELPIRFAVVLGATNLDATPEWDAIYYAIAQSGVDYEVLALVSQPKLQTHIGGQADPDVTVESMPLDEIALVDRLEAFHPNFLHLFCHGSASFDDYLEVATRDVSNFGGDPIYLPKGELLRLRGMLWLLTLDACEGATPTGNLHSYTYSLVMKGMPAAIGMREPIEANDASVFCGAFYEAALAYLHNELQAGGISVKLSWEFALRSARAALCAMFPGPAAITATRHKPWTLPVLYRKPGDFKLLVPPSSDDTAEVARKLGELATYRTARDGLPPTAPQQVRDQLNDLIRQAERDLQTLAGGEVAG
ncbi:MAG: CHAT domain-containing protein, partial [Parahaliea sp.]